MGLHVADYASFPHSAYKEVGPAVVASVYEIFREVVVGFCFVT